MARYRAEIVIAADRYVCLQLPEHLPEGRAVVTVHFPDATADGAIPTRDEADADPDDIEWWDEFDEDGARPGGGSALSEDGRD